MSSSRRVILWSEMRPRVSVSHVCGSTPFSLAVSISVGDTRLTMMCNGRSTMAMTPPPGHTKTRTKFMLLRRHLNVALWHEAEVQGCYILGPITAALPTLGPECRLLYRGLGQGLSGYVMPYSFCMSFCTG